MNPLSTMPAASIVDNPSYFTMEGTACVPKSSSGAKPKIQRFKWLKMKNKVSNKARDEAETQPDTAASEIVQHSVESRSCRVSGLDPLRVETIYYNCISEPVAPANTLARVITTHRTSAETDTDDDVFDDELAPAMLAPGTKPNVSGKALRKRRNSFGAWFRTSLSSVKRSASASSAATESASTALPSSSRILPGVSSSAVSLTYRPEMKSKSRLPQPKSSALLTSTSTVPSVAQPPSPSHQLPHLRGSVKSKSTPTRIPAPPSLTKTVSLGPVPEPRSKISLAARSSLGAVTPSASPKKRSIPQYCNQRVYQFSGTISLGRQFDHDSLPKASITASACTQYSQDSEAGPKGSSGPANKHALVTEPKIDSAIRRDGTHAENGSREISDPTSRSNASKLPVVSMQEEDNYLVPNQPPRTESCGEGNDSSASSDVPLDSAAKVVTKAGCLLEKSKSCVEKRDSDATQTTLLTTAFTIGCTHHKNPRRRCLRCTTKHDTMALPVYDVVILFSSKCEVSYAWTYYLHQQMAEKLRPDTGPPLSIWIRDIESLYQPSVAGSKFSSHEYVNHCTSSTSNESSSRVVASQEHMRTMVFSARLQVILLSREVLLHVIKHAEDPLGNLFKPERVIALFVGLDEKRDINEYHRSALYSFRDWVHIGLEDGEVGPVFQFLEWSARILQRIPRLTSKAQAAFKLHPRRVRLDENKVMVSLTKTGTTDHQATVMIGIRETEMEAAEVLEWVNPWAFIFVVPDHFLHLDCTLRVMPTVDGKELGVKELQCRSMTRDLSAILKDLSVNPIHMLCQAMGVKSLDREELDVLLFQQFKGNFAWPGFSWFHMPSPTVTKRNEVFPTLLHFAARYGLERFAWALLECPGAEVALQIENVTGLNPVGIAESQNFAALARCMREYAQVSEYSVLVDYARAVRDTEGQPFTVWDCPEQPTYVTLLEDKPTPQFAEPDHPDATDTQASELREEPPRPASYLIVCGEEECHKKYSLQDELIEIMEEFKNKTVTINQAEQLFHQWRQRMDVEKSMAEKARELEEMRKQFETMQKELRTGADQKKQSPFDKLSRFLKLTKNTPTANQKGDIPATSAGKERGVDSTALSCASQFDTGHSNPNHIDCSSSDRLSTTSTASAVSNSDSGAHSDSGDDPHPKVVPDYARPPPGRFPYTPPTHQCPKKLGIPRYQVPPQPRRLLTSLEVPEEFALHSRPRPPPRRSRTPVIQSESVYIVPGESEIEEEDLPSATLHVNTNADPASDTYSEMLPSPHHIQKLLKPQSVNGEVKLSEDEYGVLTECASSRTWDRSLHGTETEATESIYLEMTHSSSFSSSAPDLNVTCATESRVQRSLSSQSANGEVKRSGDEYGVLAECASSQTWDRSLHGSKTAATESVYLEMTPSVSHSSSVPDLNATSSTENRVFVDSGSTPNLAKNGLFRGVPTPFSCASVSANMLPNYEQKGGESEHIQQSHSLPSTPSLRPRPLSPVPPPPPPPPIVKRNGPTPPPLPPKHSDMLGKRKLPALPPSVPRRTTSPAKAQSSRSNSSELLTSSKPLPPPRPPKADRSNPDLCCPK